MIKLQLIKVADLRFSVDSGGGASDNLSGLGELLTVDSGEVVTFPAVYQHIEDIPVFTQIR